MNDLIVKLIKYQEREGLSNSALAEMLGLSDSMISYLKSGKKQAGQKTAKAIYWMIEELKTECEKFWRGENATVN